MLQFQIEFTVKLSLLNNVMLPFNPSWHILQIHLSVFQIITYGIQDIIRLRTMAITLE